MMRMSFHARVERMDRIQYIFENVGFGEPMVRCKCSDYPGRLAILTTTGVMLITDKDEKTLITAYIPTLERIKAIYNKYDLRMPSRIYKLMERVQVYNIM